MKVVDAFWQQNNLGVTSTEFVVEQSDSFASIHEQLLQSQTDYDVAFVPPMKMDVIAGLEQIGFSFIETMISFKHNLKNIKPLEAVQSLKEQHELRECNDLESIFRQIQNGMFTTDRVSADPHFQGLDTSRRYINRMIEERDSLKIFEWYNHIEPVAFIAIKDCGKGVWFSFLGGAYPQFAGYGLGYLAIYSGLELAIKYGARRMKTGTSSNNLSSVKIHLALGYQITEMQYVLVRHRNAPATS